MRIGVLGTGVVGATIAGKLVAVGQEVRMGSRAPGNAKAVAWAEKSGASASQGSFADAAAFAEELVFNCTAGTHSLEALELAGADNLLGKILVDLANPLDFSRGMPPTLTVCNDDSLGERIQRLYPAVRVVKTLNTVNSALMVDPGALPEDHDLFVSGDDPVAKSRVVDALVDWFGWKRERIHDLGDISTSRGTEMLLPLWVRLYAANQSPRFNFRIVKGSAPA
jgi:hypothetical protein